MSLTFYSSRGAPNPRRVEVFLAEHGLREGEVRPRVAPCLCSCMMLQQRCTPRPASPLDTPRQGWAQAVMQGSGPSHLLLVFSTEQGYDFVDIEMGAGQHKKGGKYTTPNQKVPMMVLEDGTQLGESVAICRYVEETIGENGLLFGTDPTERALIEMWQRRVELELLSGAVGKAWINGPVLGSFPRFPRVFSMRYILMYARLLYRGDAERPRHGGSRL